MYGWDRPSFQTNEVILVKTRENKNFVRKNNGDFRKLMKIARDINGIDLFFMNFSFDLKHYSRTNLEKPGSLACLTHSQNQSQSFLCVVL